MTKVRKYTRTVLIVPYFVGGYEIHRFEYEVMADMYYAAALSQPAVRKIAMYLGDDTTGELFCSHNKDEARA